MTNIVASEGPAIGDYYFGPLLEDSKDVVSFRLVTMYIPGEDIQVTRFDVKKGRTQKVVAIKSGIFAYRSGQKISPEDPLIEPKGVTSTSAILADRETLIKTLRAMADALESLK